MWDFGFTKYSSCMLTWNKMTNLKTLQYWKGLFLKVTLVVTILVNLGIHEVNADEVPAFFLKIAKNLPRIGRSEPNENFYDRTGDDYHVSQITKRKIGFNTESDTRAWKNFPLSIEGPPELWRTLAGYSQDPLYRATDDFNNELWIRDKRAKDHQV